MPLRWLQKKKGYLCIAKLWKWKQKQGSTKSGERYNRSGKEYKWFRLAHLRDKNSQSVTLKIKSIYVCLFSQKKHQKAKFTDLNVNDREKFYRQMWNEIWVSIRQSKI